MQYHHHIMSSSYHYAPVAWIGGSSHRCAFAQFFFQHEMAILFRAQTNGCTTTTTIIATDSNDRLCVSTSVADFIGSERFHFPNIYTGRPATRVDQDACQNSVLDADELYRKEGGQADEVFRRRDFGTNFDQPFPDEIDANHGQQAAVKEVRDVREDGERHDDHQRLTKCQNQSCESRSNAGSQAENALREYIRPGVPAREP
mmetsp:Transcript_10339/g.29489  ORF Transcript_10339/g.29489 Transcript_10339/m.29489 type:complete len:202 (+) Transcript_10339:46-651(+)